MKKRLNLLCAIVLLALGWSVIETGYYLMVGARMGVEAGWNYAKAEAEAKKRGEELEMPEKLQEFRHATYISLLTPALHGEGKELFTDSVYNKKSGRYVPASYATMIVSVEKSVPWGKGLLAVVEFVAAVWALVLFIRLVVSINRSDIFSWRNVRRLRRLGILLLVVFGCNWLGSWLELQAVREVLSVPNYDLILPDDSRGVALLLGLCSLIVAEVFAIGLRMKEEQDLTI